MCRFTNMYIISKIAIVSTPINIFTITERQSIGASTIGLMSAMAISCDVVSIGTVNTLSDSE